MEFSASVSVDCLDSVSDYVISKKISCSLWKISKVSVFEIVYQGVINDELFRISEENMCTMFISVGKSYMEFLREKPWELDVIPESDSHCISTIIVQDRPEDNVCFTKEEIINENIPLNRTTVKAALIEFSKKYKTQVKKRREIVEELTLKYGYSEHLILPANYEISLDNRLPKLFRKVGYGRYECLGHNSKWASDMDDDFKITTNSNERERIIKIIITYFKNGFRKSSNIDFERFKNYYVDEYKSEFEYELNVFEYLQIDEAMIYEDRVFIYGDEAINSIRLHLEQTVSPCISIDLFFEKFSNELYSVNIFSIEMLKAFIKRYYLDITVKWDYILMSEDASPSCLIRDAFSERESWTLDELKERLPYMKMDTIRYTMNETEYFCISRETYTHIDSIDLPDHEGERMQIFVESVLQNHDYVIANDLDLSLFMDLNPHCSFAAIRDAAFYKFLSAKYSKCGQVISCTGAKLRVLDILEQYCREADSVSLEELKRLESTFDPKGRTHSQCLVAGHNRMVRVNAELFVSDNQVDFDVVGIDEVIAFYCSDSFIPLQGITDLSLFPFARFPWNLFLLESYVRRFSHMYGYDARVVNSTNIGVIVRKSFVYDDYDDILAHALARSQVNLSDKATVGNYLHDMGYLGWRNLGKNEIKIINCAKNIRDRGAI